MTTILKKLWQRDNSPPSLFPRVVQTSYTSRPVDIPETFLAPLSDPSTIEVKKIDFANTELSEHEGRHAIVLDNVLSKEECNQLIHMAEMSAGGHKGEESPKNNGWETAMVNAGPGHEFHAPDYRNSDRIIWDEPEITRRLWQRVLQGEGMKEEMLTLHGEKYASAIGRTAFNHGQRWKATEQGINERMRFLKYGPGQFFRRHCDGPYITPDGKQESYYTIQLYLNDSAQALGIPEPADGDTDPRIVGSANKPAEIVRGGATTFHSRKGEHRLDIDPKAGRALIFQHKGLLHSGDDVKAGVKFTIRSDIMYEQDLSCNLEDGSGVEN